MINKSPFLSICIPTWEIRGAGAGYLEHTFNILANQTFTNFNVIISDNSQDDSIKDISEKWSNILDIKYFRNENGRGKIAPNLNYGMSKCNGQYIKILFQDDFLYDVDSLQLIYDYIQTNPDTKWLLTGCCHTEDAITMEKIMQPVYHDKIYLGHNTISCPSVMTIKNDNEMLIFDESLIWLVDVDYYKKCFNKFGLPDIINAIAVVNREQPNRVTKSMTQEIIDKETQQLYNRYENLR
jgi:glycosyltransferase involved in cell wall biosynthesis